MWAQPSRKQLSQQALGEATVQPLVWTQRSRNQLCWQALDEATVQHLREALWLTRQAAVDSLRHSRGDVEAAVRQELAAYGMDGASLRCLATEYAVYRCLGFSFR